MKRIFLGLIIVGLLGGCAPLIPVKIDVSTAKELPKDIAISYLNEISNRHPGLHWTKMQCIFHEDHVTNRHGSSKTYKQIKFWADVYEPEAILSLYLDRFCVIGDVMGFKNHSDPEINVIANKISTALKSLGVQVKMKQ